MMNFRIFLFASVFFTNSIAAQVTIRNRCNTEQPILIGARVGDKIFAIDTVKGKIFESSLKGPGMYALIQNGNLIGDFIIKRVEDSFEISINCDSIINSSSQYNSDFKKFVRSIDSLKEASYQSMTEESKELLEWCYPQLRVKNEYSNARTNFDFNTIFIQYFTESQDFLRQSPFFEMNLEYYFSNLISQDQDTLIKYIPKLEQVLRTDALNYFKRWALHRFESSKVLGHENVFIDLALRYVGTRGPIFDSATDYNVLSKAKLLFPNRIGTVVSDFTFNQFVGGAQKRFTECEGIYKVIFFFDPDCHHCKESFPDLIKFSSDYASHGVKVYAISVGVDNEELKEFWDEFGGPATVVLGSDTDVSKVTFRNFYHIPSTPTIYLVQSNGICIARGISASELSKLFEQIVNN
jgi:thiol-disulfide isomerase/thioredoxin